MFARTMNGAFRVAVLTALLAAGAASVALAQARERLRIPVGRAEVITLNDEVRTVAIAEPKIADAAVGSARSVVVNAKAPGVTSLVVYSEGGRFRVWDIEAFVPNADRQVLLRTRVAELRETAQRELGFDWWGQGSTPLPWLDGALQGGLYTTKVSSPSAPLTVGSETDGFLAYRKLSGEWELQATWRMLEEKGDLRTLANPTLVARSGEIASFIAGGEVAVPIASSAGAGNAVTVTIEWKSYGVKVQFTPTVRENGDISMKVETEVSEIDRSTPFALNAFVLPSFLTRKTATTVEMKSGEYLVIGGLKQTDKTRVVKKVPVLGDVPLLGFFFRNTRVEETSHDLIMVVSPEVVMPSAGAMPDGPGVEKPAAPAPATPAPGMKR